MIEMAVGQKNAFKGQTLLIQEPFHRAAGFGRINQDAGFPVRVDQNIGVGFKRTAGETPDDKGSIRFQDSPAGRDWTDSGHDRTHTPQMCTPIPLSLENSVSFAWHRSSL